MVAFHQRKSSGGTIYQSHFQNYITVFWVPLKWLLILGAATAIITGLAYAANVGFLPGPIEYGLAVGVVIFFFAFWQLWRVVKGILQVKDGLPYDDNVGKVDRLKHIERNKSQIELGAVAAEQKSQNSTQESFLSDIENSNDWQEDQQSNRLKKDEIDINAAKIDALHQSGVLSDSEYNAAKSRISIENDPRLIELGILHKKGVLSDTEYESARTRVEAEFDTNQKNDSGN